MKKLIAILVALSLVTVLTAASCGGSGSSAGTGVHMGETTFLQPSVTISKGSSHMAADLSRLEPLRAQERR